MIGDEGGSASRVHPGRARGRRSSARGELADLRQRAPYDPDRHHGAGPAGLRRAGRPAPPRRRAGCWRSASRWAARPAEGRSGRGAGRRARNPLPAARRRSPISSGGWSPWLPSRSLDVDLEAEKLARRRPAGPSRRDLDLLDAVVSSACRWIHTAAARANSATEATTLTSTVRARTATTTTEIARPATSSSAIVATRSAARAANIRAILRIRAGTVPSDDERRAGRTAGQPQRQRTSVHGHRPRAGRGARRSCSTPWPSPRSSDGTRWRTSSPAGRGSSTPGRRLGDLARDDVEAYACFRVGLPPRAGPAAGQRLAGQWLRAVERGGEPGVPPVGAGLGPDGGPDRRRRRSGSLRRLPRPARPRWGTRSGLTRSLAAAIAHRT